MGVKTYLSRVPISNLKNYPFSSMKRCAVARPSEGRLHTWREGVRWGLRFTALHCSALLTSLLPAPNRLPTSPQVISGLGTIHYLQSPPWLSLQDCDVRRMCLVLTDLFYVRYLWIPEQSAKFHFLLCFSYPHTIKNSQIVVVFSLCTFSASTLQEEKKV